MTQQLEDPNTLALLGRYHVVAIEDALRTGSTQPPFPPIDDREAWERIRLVLSDDEVSQVLRQAEAAAREPIPPLPAGLYLEFLRNGDRAGYEQPTHWRREALWSLALAECLDNQGRFLDPLLDLGWAVCEESSWAWPAHQRQLADPERPWIDLAAAMTALELAELDLLLGSRLHTALGRRIRAEVERRCLAPYLTRHDRWWLHGSGGRSLNNWTAVCNAGVAGAALYSSGTRAGWRRSWRGRFARYDSHFVQTGVSFFASSGDNGTPASYPSASPNIISVGGTTLSFSNGVLTAETGWSGSGGGCSRFERATAAQSGFSQYAQVNCKGKRATPDVSLDADPAFGVSVYDSTPYYGSTGWWQVGGTSASSPMWAARSAVAGAVVNATYVYGGSITYRDITSGNKGASALVGFDLVTGRGSWTGLTP